MDFRNVKPKDSITFKIIDSKYLLRFIGRYYLIVSLIFIVVHLYELFLSDVILSFSDKLISILGYPTLCLFIIFIPAGWWSRRNLNKKWANTFKKPELLHFLEMGFEKDDYGLTYSSNSISVRIYLHISNYIGIDIYGVEKKPILIPQDSDIKNEINSIIEPYLNQK